MHKILIIYDSRDLQWKEALQTHFGVYTRSKKVMVYGIFDQLDPGSSRNEALRQELSTASLIIALLSSKFLDSSLMRNTYVRNSLAEFKNKKLLLPLIISPCLWKDEALFAELEVRPRQNLDLSSFENSEAERELLRFVQEVNGLLTELSPPEELPTKTLVAPIKNQIQEKADFDTLAKWHPIATEKKKLETESLFQEKANRPKKFTRILATLLLLTLIGYYVGSNHLIRNQDSILKSLKIRTSILKCRLNKEVCTITGYHNDQELKKIYGADYSKFIDEHFEDAFLDQNEVIKIQALEFKDEENLISLTFCPTDQFADGRYLFKFLFQRKESEFWKKIDFEKTISRNEADWIWSPLKIAGRNVENTEFIQYAALKSQTCSEFKIVLN